MRAGLAATMAALAAVAGAPSRELEAPDLAGYELERPRYVGPRGENRRRRRRRHDRQRRARAIRQMQRNSRKANRGH